MKDEDIQKLLGGFATDTLTNQERELLFTASLTNQELFNALADDQALKEFLSDPASRMQLLRALQPAAAEPGLMERLTGWMRRPAAWGVAGTVMAALVVAVALRQQQPAPPVEPAAAPVAKAVRPESPAQSPPAVQEQPAPGSPPVRETPAPRRDEARYRAAPARALEDSARAEKKAAESKDREAASRTAPAAAAPPAASAHKNELAAASPAPKLRVAVLDFDAGPAQSKEAAAGGADVGQAASDLLGKKLDSSGYTVIDRKEVDKALQEKNLKQRQLDAPTAAGVGRSVGADAVILGSVKPAPQATQKGQGLVGGLRAKTVRPAAEEVQVTAQAINTQNAANLGVAVAQGEQIPGGGLARTMDQVASSLGQQIQQNTRRIEGQVTDVNATILTLNLGSKTGIKTGDRLEVRRAGKPVGRVVITTVKDTFSVGVFEGAGTARTGDIVATQ
ncbi:MAG TPA: CsgG/HfaB family protein [Bryobacteraceae bacterium]|jgi:hypothetical protein|nr:CsgG/HfaB family protein [Bryobacteraceae bacterium]